MAARSSIKIDCGSTWRQTLIWKDAAGARISLAGFTAKMQIRPNYGETVIVELNTTNSRILLEQQSVDGSSVGVIQLYLTDEATAAIEPTEGVYDLLVISAGGEATRLVEGNATFRAAVTTQ